MKRNLPVILLLAFAAALVLAACAGGGEPKLHTVTFYDDGMIISLQQVEDGGAIEELPERDKLWQDASGAFAEPMETPVTRDLAFYAWRAPEVRTDAALFMKPTGSRFMPETAVTRAEAAELFRALLADGAAGLSGRSFSDVPASDAHYDAISAVSALGLMSGYPDGTFRPSESMTRAEFVSVLHRIAGAEEPASAASGFADVPQGYWAAEPIAYAAEKGWIFGIGGEKFYPEKELTRAEAAVIAVRARGSQVDPAAVDIACGGVSPYVDVLPTNWAYYEIIDASYTNELLEYITGRAAGMQPGFAVINGRLCHVDAETLRLDRYPAGFSTIDGGLYYVRQEGYFIERFNEGLLELDGAMFYVPEAGGPFLTDDSFGYLYFGPDGRYTSGDAEVDGYVDDILSDILYDRTLTQEEKLYRAYCVIRDDGYYYRSRWDSGWDRGTVDWAPFCARVMYSEKGGTCYYWAAAFLYLARRLGYQAYPVCGGVGTANQLHAWVVIEWDDGEDYIFDVELEWGYRNGFYTVSFMTTDMYKQPLNATHATYVFPNQTATYYAAYGVREEESDADLLDIPESQQVPPPESVPAEQPTDTTPAEQPAEAEAVPAEETPAQTETVPAESEPQEAVQPDGPAPAEEPVEESAPAGGE